MQKLNACGNSTNNLLAPTSFSGNHKRTWRNTSNRSISILPNNRRLKLPTHAYNEKASILMDDILMRKRKMCSPVSDHFAPRAPRRGRAIANGTLIRPRGGRRIGSGAKRIFKLGPDGFLRSHREEPPDLLLPGGRDPPFPPDNNPSHREHQTDHKDQARKP